MYDVIQSDTFQRWLCAVRDRDAKIRVNVRIRRLSLGHIGDVRHVGRGVRELRIDYGPGYRVYFIHRSTSLVILLCGGDKRSQQHDIEAAIRLATSWDNQP